MNFPWHLFPKNPSAQPVVEFAVEDFTFLHTDENGKRHDIPRHISEILGLPDLLDQFPDESEFVFYLDDKGHLQKLPRKNIKFPEPPWGWNGARSAWLSASGPNDNVIFSRARQVEWGPRADGQEGFRA